MTVVLLHGLGRTSASLKPLAKTLDRAGFETCLIDYPSRHHDIATLAEVVSRRLPQETELSFVTHSMGGIVLRQMVTNGVVAPARVVMLAPPNQGSEVVNGLRRLPLVSRYMGPGFLQLAPGSFPDLPAVDFELGVIAGHRWTPFFSPLLPEAGDGKVTITSTRVDGMTDHRVVKAGHTWIMRHQSVQQLVLTFLRSGRFDRDAD